MVNGGDNNAKTSGNSKFCNLEHHHSRGWSMMHQLEMNALNASGIFTALVERKVKLEIIVMQIESG